MTPQTKEQLIEENAILKQRISSLESVDASMRQELSKALDAPRKNEGLSYGYSDERVTLSWFEIFREIGKLLERKQQTDLEQLVHNQERRLNDLRTHVEKLDPDSLPF